MVRSSNYYETRTLLELEVGIENLTVELQVNLRREDVSWWNDDVEGHQKQLFNICADHILPEECAKDVEDLLSRGRRGRGGSGGRTTVAIVSSSSSGSGNKRKRGLNDFATTKMTTTTSQQQNKSGKMNGVKRTKRGVGGPEQSSKVDAGEKESLPIKTDAGIGYLFGDTIQLTYKVEEIPANSCATLMYDEIGEREPLDDAERNKKEQNGSEDTATSHDNVMFSSMLKIPKRILVWCYPFDVSNPTVPNPPGGGFPRPELVPITSLFRNEDDT